MKLKLHKDTNKVSIPKRDLVWLGQFSERLLSLIAPVSIPKRDLVWLGRAQSGAVLMSWQVSIPKRDLVWLGPTGKSQYSGLL